MRVPRCMGGLLHHRVIVFLSRGRATSLDFSRRRKGGFKHHLLERPKRSFRLMLAASKSEAALYPFTMAGSSDTSRSSTSIERGTPLARFPSPRELPQQREWQPKTHSTTMRCSSPTCANSDRPKQVEHLECPRHCPSNTPRAQETQTRFQASRASPEDGKMW